MRTKERKNGGLERQILTGMVVNDRVLGQLTPRWDGKLFKSQWANTVGSWCVKYFTNHQEAPRTNLTSMFESWAEGEADTESVDLIEEFLHVLSGEYDQVADDVNPDHVLDLAGKHFNEVRLRNLSEQITGDLEMGKPEKAEGRVTGYGRVEIGQGSGRDVLLEEDAIRSAFEDQAESLVRWPDPLARFYQHDMARDSLVAYMAPEKRGKTFRLIDTAWRAMTQRKRVAFFSVGDMSEAQMYRRLGARAARKPFRPGTLWVPESIHKDEEGEIQVERVEKEYKTGLQWGEAWAAFQRIRKTKVKSKKSYFKLSTHPNSSIDVAGIEAILQQWEHSEDWVADVVVIDYADILLMSNAGSEIRDQINQTWKDLRKLSQTRHCLIVTATQADAASYHSQLLLMDNFSEDKRKYAHVTALYGINQSPEEKLKGLQRLNVIVRREGDYSPYHCAYTAGVPALSMPSIRCFFD